MSRPQSETFVGPRARPWILAALGLSLGLLVAAMGTVALDAPGPDEAALRERVVRDLQRLRAAVADHTLDTGSFPSAARDLCAGDDGGLTDASAAPAGARVRWKGPYLAGPLTRPSPHAYWSLVTPRRLLDRDGDGEEDESWARLNRGDGELDDELAAWVDRTLDDGRPDAGAVRVTTSWIWFHLLER